MSRWTPLVCGGKSLPGFWIANGTPFDLCPIESNQRAAVMCDRLLRMAREGRSRSLQLRAHLQLPGASTLGAGAVAGVFPGKIGGSARWSCDPAGPFDDPLWRRNGTWQPAPAL